MSASSDDDIFVIGLWIIAIGFIILAIDKTIKLTGSESEQSSQSIQLTQLIPKNHNQDQDTDQQYQQIQQQLTQFGNSLSEIKRKIQNKC